MEIESVDLVGETSSTSKLRVPAVAVKVVPALDTDCPTANQV